MGFGVAPFWLDGKTAGYARAAGRLTGTNPGIFIVSLPESEPQMLLSLKALEPHLPEDVAVDNLLVRSIAPSPTDKDLLFILFAIYNPDEGKTNGGMLFSFQRQTGEITLRLQLPYNLPPYNPLSFSPDGRWLVLKTSARTGGDSNLYVHDIAANQTNLFPSTYPYGFPGYDWSADGQWLLRVENGFLHLVAPAYNYHQFLVHDFPSCKFAAWVQDTPD